MIGVKIDSSDKKVCTGLVATTRFRCRFLLQGMNVPRERNQPGEGRSENRAKLSQSYPLILGVKKVIAAG